MSLRIYIKGNNNSSTKLGSPNKTSASASQLPQFNQIPPSRMPKPSKKALERDSSKDNSAILESIPQENEYAFRSFGENSHSTPALSQKISAGLHNDRYFEHSRDEKIDAENVILPRSKQDIQRDKQAYAKKMLNRTSLSDKQLRTTVQECDNIIMALFEEAEKLHDLYSQKAKEVEVFRDLDNSFHMNKTSKMKSDLDKSAEFENEKSDNIRLKKENVRLIEMVRRLTDSNTELNEETSILREMASSTEQTLQKERESFKALREKAEALVIMNEELNSRLEEKENHVVKLNASLQESFEKTQKLMLETRTKDQALEEYKKSVFSGQVQSSFGGGNFGSAQKSTGAGSLKNSSVLSTDWQNKFETSKAENAKLLQIIEGNQHVIKDLKQTLSNLETRSAQRFEELKSLYENKIKSMSAGGTKRAEIQDEAQTKMLPPPSSYSSSYRHSQKPSYDQNTWKGLGQMY